MEFHLENIIGKSKAIRDVLEMVKKVAPTLATVLITGDSGTGKELIALAIHAHSDRKDKLFLPVNCGALPETLLESLLFGHMKGSFTGRFCQSGRAYLIRPAEELFYWMRSAKSQPSPGETSARPGGERNIADRQHDSPPYRRPGVGRHKQKLKKEVEEGRFREDLYYRLNIMEIHIPPLCERPEDIPLLVDHLIKKHNPELKKNCQGIDEEVMRILTSLPWKGNVRELDNVIEHTMILAEGNHDHAEGSSGLYFTSGEPRPRLPTT